MASRRHHILYVAERRKFFLLFNSVSYIYFLVCISNKMHMLQTLFYLTTALHVSGVTVTPLQEHKITVITASGKRHTVIDRVKFTDKEYR
jgi:uncharacterized membrane-anchored protein YitT (DUF2179 family)